MAHRKFHHLLDDLEIEARLEASGEDLHLPLRDLRGFIGRAQIDASGEAFSLFGRSIPVRGAGDVSFQIHAPDSTLQIDGIQPANPPGPEQVLVDLDVGCTSAVNPTRRRYRGPRLELVPRGDTGLRYRHVRSMPIGAKGKEAVTELVSRAKLPHHIDLDGSAPPVELHQVSGRMRFNLNLDFEVGWQQAVPGLEGLLRELGENKVIDFDLEVSAGFGLAMVEDFALTVGRGPGITQNPNWVRAGISRKHQRELSFGARFALTIGLDLGNPLETIFDRILDRRGWRELSAALATVGRLRPAFEAAAAGNWGTLTELVDVETAEIVRDVLQRTRALEADAAASVVRRIVEVADFFEELSPQVQGLWETALDGFLCNGAGPMVEALELIAAIGEDPDEDVVVALLQTLAGPSGRTAKPAVMLLELLTGIDLENIVIGGATVRDQLLQAARDAGQALSFLDRLNKLPERVFDGLRSALDSTRAGTVIRGILEIEKPEDLARLAGSGSGTIVRRLIEGGIEDATEADLQRVRLWASKVLPILDAAGIQGWIRDRMAALNQDLGFALGLELDLLTRRSRILDLELDPSTTVAKKTLSDLGKGDIRGAVAGLAEERFGGFFVHDCVFTSHRSRVSALHMLLSLLGWRSDTTRLVTEDWVRLQHKPAGAARRARFSGGVVRRVARSGRRTEGGAWLTHRVEGAGFDMSGPYQPTIDTELRLSFSTREDEATLAGLQAIDGLLFDLGFLATPDRFHTDCVPGVTTSLALSIRFGEGAVDALLSGLDERVSWCVDARNALHRWFTDRAVDVGLPGRKDIRRGDALAAIVRSSLYSRACSTSSLRFETDLANAVLRMTINDREGRPHTVRLSPVRQRGGAPVPYPPLAAPITAVQGLLKDTRRRLRDLESAREAIKQTTEVTASELTDLSRKFCRAMAAADNSQWPSPTLPLWLVIARLARSSPETLAAARGVATVRIRQAAADEWEIVERLQTTDGVPRHRIGDPAGVFPIGS